MSIRAISTSLCRQMSQQLGDLTRYQQRASELFQSTGKAALSYTVQSRACRGRFPHLNSSIHPKIIRFLRPRAAPAPDKGFRLNCHANPLRATGIGPAQVLHMEPGVEWALMLKFEVGREGSRRRLGLPAVTFPPSRRSAIHLSADASVEMRPCIEFTDIRGTSCAAL